MKRGFTLIELIAVMTIASVVFTVLSVAIFALHRTQSQVQSEWNVAMTVSDFAHRLRTDAHDARQFTLEGNGAEVENGRAWPSLLLILDDGRRIVYDFQHDAARIRRQVFRGEERIHHDAYLLPRGAEVHWEPPAEGEAPLLAVIVARPAGREPAGQRPQRKTRIEALVGLERSR